LIRRAHTRLEHEKLVPYVHNLLQRCAAQPGLEALQPRLDAVKTAFDDFNAKLFEAVDGGRDRTARKKHAYEALIEQLDQLVLAAELERVPVEVLVEAGFELAAEKRSRAGTEISPPEIRSASQQGAGTIAIEFVHPDAKSVQNYALEWSSDAGVTWQSGTFGKRSPIRLSSLPSMHHVQVRMCSLATHGRRSAWTEPVTAFVL
jgi:hypothetical protein